jgi:hypothetical protein
MISGISSYQQRSDVRTHDNNQLLDTSEALIRAVRAECGKDCFATDLRFVCVDFSCRWQDDCDRLGVC